jgi:hypothetical protein
MTKLNSEEREARRKKMQIEARGQAMQKRAKESLEPVAYHLSEADLSEIISNLSIKGYPEYTQIPAYSYIGERYKYYRDTELLPFGICEHLAKLDWLKRYLVPKVLSEPIKDGGDGFGGEGQPYGT